MATQYINQPSRILRYLSLVAVFVATIVLLINSNTAFTENYRADNLPLPLLVNSDQLVLEQGFELKRSFVGQVEAAQTTGIGFELAGRITSIEFDEGDEIEQGQLIAQLDTQRLQSQRLQLLAQKQEIQTQISLAKKTVARLDKALEYGGVTPQRLDEAKQLLQSSSARLNTIKASIHSIDVEIEKSIIRAPYDGVVITRFVDLGSIVSAGVPIINLQQQTQPQARIGVTNSMLSQITLDKKLKVKVEGDSVNATVKEILDQRNTISRTVDVILELEMTDVRSGDLVKLELSIYKKLPGHWLPVSALSEGERGLWTILTAKPIEDSEFSTLERVFVEILHQDTERVYIKGLPKRSYPYVQDGLQRIVPGQTVRLDKSNVKTLVGISS